MKPTRKEISDAAYEGNIALLKEYASKGADFNEVEDNGDSIFEDIIFDLCVDEKPFRYDVVITLLRLGAHPNILGRERSTPLLPAMLTMDTEMLRILLENGADPNIGDGFSETENLYDWAEFDYRYQVYNLYVPHDSPEYVKMNEDEWLIYLDRIAVKHNKRRPDHLLLMREFGAKCAYELKPLR